MRDRAGTAACSSPVHWPRWCRPTSAANVISALRTNRAVPSGWWQAPRPVTRPGPALHVGDLLWPRWPADGDLGEGGGHPRQPVQARSALAGAFQRQVPNDRAPSPSAPHRSGGEVMTMPAPTRRRAAASDWLSRRQPRAPRRRRATCRGSRRSAPPGPARTSLAGPSAACRGGPRLTRGAPSARRMVHEHRAWLGRRAYLPEPAAGPCRAISATWASVSAFCTSVGAPSSPRSVIRGGMKVGIAGPARQVADQRRLLAGQEARRGLRELDRHPVGAAGDAFRDGFRSRPAHVVRRSTCVYRMAWSAPTASAASCRPSRPGAGTATAAWRPSRWPARSPRRSR